MRAKTKNNNFSVDVNDIEDTTIDKSNLSVSFAVKHLLPEALIDYLWQLAFSDDWMAFEKQSFILNVDELGGRQIIDICHFCEYGGAFDTKRVYVYGAEPVNCELEVLSNQYEAQMTMTA